LPQYHVGPDGALLHYYGVPEEGIDLWFTITMTRSNAIRVMTAVEGLPGTTAGPLPPRAAGMMSKPFVATDMTMISWLVKI
jgi:hypothetical protein